MFPYQVIPRRWLSGSIDFWLGIWQQDLPSSPIQFRVRTNGGAAQTFDIPHTRWGRRGSPARRRVWHTVWSAGNLQPATEYVCDLLVGGAVQATGIARTLPNSLPNTGSASRPFNVFVGSCYYRRNDPQRRIPEAYMELWNQGQWRPDVKFLCGDQIYFDNPPTDFLTIRRDIRAWIRQRLTNKYRTTWRDLDPLLSRGITYFLTDDHEYWNDYPNRQNGAWVFATHNRDDYLQRRTEAFANDFQWAGVSEGFSIGNLNFRVLDTRRHRSLGARTFAQQQDVDSTINWLKNLRSPGVLVLSSPIFVPRTENSSFNFAVTDGRVITDHNLPFFDAQFLPLAHALLEAQADVVVVAGDPHFSRVAECNVPAHPANNNRAHKIVEVISSAMATVDGAGGMPRRGPDLFPMPGQAHPSIPSSNIQYLDFSTINQQRNQAADNFVTLSFTRVRDDNDISANVVQMRVRSWFCKRRDGNLQPPIPVDFDRVIQLNGVPRITFPPGGIEPVVIPPS
jgi:hypothetical protein